MGTDWPKSLGRALPWSGSLLLSVILGFAAGASWSGDVPSDKWLIPAISAFVAISALFVSLATLRLAIGAPELRVTPPRLVRVEFQPNHTILFLQPLFTVANLTNRTGHVTHMEVWVKAVGDAREREFEWMHIVQFGWDRENQEETYEKRLSDAVPVAVSFSKPEAPMAEFAGPPGHLLQPDACYRARIVASTSSGRTPKEGMLWFEIPLDEWHRLMARKDTKETTYSLLRANTPDCSGP